jgi:hypothetical protein
MGIYEMMERRELMPTEEQRIRGHGNFSALTGFRWEYI